MTEYPPVTLRVEPQAIPALRRAFENALAEIGPPLDRLGEVGHIPGAWLGDPKSQEVVTLYNDRVMRAVDGPYEALVQYEQELTRVRDQLAAMEQEYARTETANVDALGSTL